MDPFLDASAPEEVMAHGPRLSRGDDRTGASRSGTDRVVYCDRSASQPPTKGRDFQATVGLLVLGCTRGTGPIAASTGALGPDPRGASSPRSPVA